MAYAKYVQSTNVAQRKQVKTKGMEEMKKICSILILIVLLLNSSVMVLISEAVEAVSEMLAANENNIQTTQQVALEKYINYAKKKYKEKMRN